MSKIEAGLRYSESHEWVRIENGSAYIGISDYAQKELGDITYADLPEMDAVRKGEEFGALESVKASSDLYAPVSGTVVEINSEVVDAPEKINEDPYGSWLIRVNCADASEIDSLMDAESYKSFIGE